MNKPGVSIVIPAYNAEKFVLDTLNSVRGQSYADWEVILVDDGSTDGTVRVAEGFLADNPGRMTIITHPYGENRGTSASRNLGLQKAAGELVCFLDADDIWLPDFLEFFVARFNRFPELLMAYGPCIYWHPEPDGPGKAPDPVQLTGCAGGIVAAAKLFKLYLEYENCVPSPSGVMIRRSRLLEAGGWEDEFKGMFDDQVLYSKLFLLGGPVFVAAKPLYRYRQHAESLCHQAVQGQRLYESRKTYLAWLRGFVERLGPAHGVLLKKVDEQATLLELRNHIDRKFASRSSRYDAVRDVLSQVAGMKRAGEGYFNYKVIRYALSYLLTRLIGARHEA